MPEWIAVFISSWLMFFILVDKSRLKYTILGGITAMILQLIVDTGASGIGLYSVKSGYKLGGGSALFTFGAVLTMGILFVQYIPKNRWLKVAHIIVTATLFLGMEYLLVQRNLIIYTHWGMGPSWFTNILVFITITWVAQTIGVTSKQVSS
ncbi:MAG: hypothetical protein FH758_00060 [Firmicutes bacterium]|nr:hypothetical protein [Bacillota bacterium]